jgi:hypothetical protein
MKREDDLQILIGITFHGYPHHGSVSRLVWLLP